MKYMLIFMMFGGEPKTLPVKFETYKECVVVGESIQKDAYRARFWCVRQDWRLL